MDTKGTSWRGISQIQIEIENIVLFDLQLATNDIHQELAFFQFVGDDTKNRQHIFLLAEFYAIVYLTIEVDSQITDLEQGALYMQ